MKKLLDYVDIAVFVLVLAGAGFVAWSGAGTGKKEAQAALVRAEAAGTGLEKALAADRYDEDKGAEILRQLGEIPARLDAQWTPKSTPPPLGQKLFYHPGSLDDLREGRELELRFLPPQGLVADPDIGVIRLGFQANPRSTVFVTGYRVYRTDAGGQEKLVATLDSEARTWDDEAVKAGELYSYRVSATTDEVVLVQRKKAESPRSKAVSVRGKKDYEINPLRWDADASTLRVQVRKYIAGVWNEKEFDAKSGESIGRKDAGSGVDFDTGCKLDDVTAKPIKVPETRDEVEFGPDGRVVTLDGAPIRKKVTYQRDRSLVIASYRNEVGEIEKLELRQ